MWVLRLPVYVMPFPKKFTAATITRMHTSTRAQFQIRPKPHLDQKTVKWESAPKAYT